MVLLNIVCRQQGASPSNKFRVELPNGYAAQQVSLRESTIKRRFPNGTIAHATALLPGNVYVTMPHMNSDHVISNAGPARLELPYNNLHGLTAASRHLLCQRNTHDVSFYWGKIETGHFDIEFWQDPDCTIPLPLQSTEQQLNSTDKVLEFVSMTFELSHNEKRA